jgi:hypothetical protein
MNRFLLGALAMGAIFVLTSFAVGTRRAPTTGGPAWTVSQYQLDRAFRIQLPNMLSPVTTQAPATSGLIITQLKAANSSAVRVAVDGVFEDIDFGNSQGPWTVHDLNPPIIVRPGQSLTITPTYGQPVLTIAGYTTLPGET